MQNFNFVPKILLKHSDIKINTLSFDKDAFSSTVSSMDRANTGLGQADYSDFGSPFFT